MNYLVSFSPTGTTRQYLELLAAQTQEHFQSLDLTKTQAREQIYHFTKDDFMLIGCPVYYGRIPPLKERLFQNLRGKDTPVMINVVYGNRAYDDALLEFKDLMEKQGFIPVLAATWVAPHSYSEKIAANRPHSKDREMIARLGKMIREGRHCGFRPLKEVPGNRPYRDYRLLPFKPLGDHACIECMDCLGVCPVRAISQENPRLTSDDCISCMACVKICPVKSRKVRDEDFEKLVTFLENKCIIENNAEYFGDICD